MEIDELNKNFFLLKSDDKINVEVGQASILIISNSKESNDQ